jgi:hypothetical protein
LKVAVNRRCLFHSLRSFRRSTNHHTYFNIRSLSEIIRPWLYKSTTGISVPFLLREYCARLNNILCNLGGALEMPFLYIVVVCFNNQPQINGCHFLQANSNCLLLYLRIILFRAVQSLSVVCHRLVLLQQRFSNLELASTESVTSKLTS